LEKRKVKEEKKFCGRKSAAVNNAAQGSQTKKEGSGHQKAEAKKLKGKVRISIYGGINIGAHRAAGWTPGERDQL